ncbi:hypothetical protein P7K49_027446 [Saguinus oedipus]|uniref:Uncharacterized protein n=1 Tax=Saguinus oedipus TaxID=9490 RepID=A0ABQ9U9H3_SAGOE|nr:hypothetical protein P7K49_027446 [Saguinus oedipus]
MSLAEYTSVPALSFMWNDEGIQIRIREETTEIFLQMKYNAAMQHLSVQRVRRSIDLHLSAGHIYSAAQVLLQHGADPNIRNTDGKSALDLADPSAKAVLTGKNTKSYRMILSV